MKYQNGQRIQLLDHVQWNDKQGFVVGFDKVGDKEFVEVRAQVGVFSSKLWTSPNLLTKVGEKSLVVKSTDMGTEFEVIVDGVECTYCQELFNQEEMYVMGDTDMCPSCYQGMIE